VKRTDAWMPLNIGAYLGDTGRLTTEQHGAYLLILMDYWRNGPPPDDEESLASIARLPLVDWRRTSAKLRPFFTVVDGKWHQKRADEERQKALDINSKRQASGKQGAAKRYGKPVANAIPFGVANGVGNGQQDGSQNDRQVTGTSTEDLKSKAPSQGKDGVEVDLKRIDSAGVRAATGPVRLAGGLG